MIYNFTLTKVGHGYGLPFSYPVIGNSDYELIDMFIISCRYNLQWYISVLRHGERTRGAQVPFMVRSAIESLSMTKSFYLHHFIFLFQFPDHSENAEVFIKAWFSGRRYSNAQACRGSKDN